MDGECHRLLSEMFRLRREELIESAVDWVVAASIDLGSRRPRHETRALVAQLTAGYEAALLRGDEAPLRAFCDHVTSYRASSEFHISTLLRGFLSFRIAMEGALRAEACDGWVAFDALAAVSKVCDGFAFRAADMYVEKLNAIIVERRRHLEEELERVTEVKTRELDDKIETIEAQRRMLAALSSPVLRVWDGVLVAPIVGELGAERAADVQEKVLASIVGSSVRTVLVDVTGLTLVDAGVALNVVKLAQAARLLGAEAMLVGVSPAVAQALVGLAVDLGGLRSFGTLESGLRAALRA